RLRLNCVPAAQLGIKRLGIDQGLLPTKSLRDLHAAQLHAFSYCSVAQLMYSANQRLVFVLNDQTRAVFYQRSDAAIVRDDDGSATSQRFRCGILDVFIL